MKPTIYMVQIMPRLWQIRSKKGFVIQDDIMLYSKREAADYVRRYISSWDGWQYEVIELNQELKNENN